MECIAETAKRSSAIIYLDCVLSHLGLLKLNWDILASQRQCSGFQDTVSQTRTVIEKPGWLVSMAKYQHSLKV